MVRDDRRTWCLPTQRRYLDHGKSALKTSLAKVVVNGCINPPENNHLVWARLGQTAKALDQVAPPLLADALEAVVGKMEAGSGLTDSQLGQFIGSLGDLQPAWAVIPDASIPRFESAVANFDLPFLTQWRSLSVSNAPESVQSAVVARLGQLEDAELAAVIAGAPSTVLLNEALNRLRETWSWRTADYRLTYLVLPQANLFSEVEVRRLQDALEHSSDVRMASGTPPTLEQLWERTRHLPGVVPAWRDIAAYLEANAPDGDTEAYYGYPQLRARIAEGA